MDEIRHRLGIQAPEAAGPGQADDDRRPRELVDARRLRAIRAVGGEVQFWFGGSRTGA